MEDYKSINVLPFHLQLKFNKATLMFKVIAGDAPPSLTAKVVINEARHIHKIMVPLPRVDIFKSSFIYSGGCLWNLVFALLFPLRAPCIPLKTV